MSDIGRRRLERDLLLGDPAAEAPLLRARARAGTLSAERLRLAAYAGHPAARAALEREAPEAPGELETWVRGLRPFGQEVWVRAAVAAGARVLPLWSARGLCDDRPAQALEAARAWLEASDADARLEAAGAAREAADAVQPILPELELALRELQLHRDYVAALAEAFRETRACSQAALAAGSDPARALTHAVLAAVAARERLALAEVPAGPGGESLYARAAQADRLGQLPELNLPAAANAIRAAIAGALAAWALDDDPPEEAP